MADDVSHYRRLSGPDGNFTLQNVHDLFQPQILSAYWISIKVSLASALGGALIGFFLAWAVVLGNLPRWLRPTVLTFSGVASNFAGVPLAFAFWQHWAAPAS